jgi:protoporphyrinogen oxidase
MDIGIIGAGVTGLTAGYELARAGHSVTLYEARSNVGGLAAGFRDDRWDWYLDRFYHHWFESDGDVMGLVDEMGAREQIVFRRPTTSLYHEARLYPLDSPVPWLKAIPVSSFHRALRVLQFSPLPVIDRLRAGLVGVYLIASRNWHPLEKWTAHDWMRRAAGARAYEVMWEPLLISKFGDDAYQDVNMAWMWARLHKRSARLGYFVGGFQAFVDLLADRVRENGGSILLDAPATRICASEHGINVMLGDWAATHEHVIATVSPSALSKLAPALPAEYLRRLLGLRHMGAVVLILALDRQLASGHYWINLPKSEGFPFMGLVEHTNYISPERYGGDHIVYCGDYLPPGHAAFRMSKEQLLKKYLPGLTRINPAFRPGWIRASWLFTEPYAQPIPTVNHSGNIPQLRTPMHGLWVANMSQVYPWDRGTNYAVEIGRRVAREIAP